MNRNAWSPEERAEYDELLADVLTVGTNTSRRLDEAERLLSDALQAQRPWAREVERACLRDGLASEIKRYQDRTRAVVSHDGKLLNPPKVQGRTVKADDGSVSHDRALIEMWTWEQILRKRADAMKLRNAMGNAIAFYDKLLALRELCPGADSPHHAARLLGISLDEYLERGEAA